MKKPTLSLSLFLILIGLCSCATFSSKQEQTKPDGTTTKSEQSLVTFWDGNSSVAKLRASTTDKTQGLTVGGIEQETTSTNLNALIEGIIGAAVKGAVQGAK